MKGLERRIKGSLRYELCGVQPEALLNACAMEGLGFSELSIVDAYTLRLTVAESDRARFEALAPRCRCELRLLEESGGRKDRRLLRRRLPLLLIALAVLLTLLLSSLFIWEIELKGGEELSRGELLRALEECGVSPGVFWPALDADAVRARMLDKLPELAWMTVNVRGSRATVLLLPRSEKPEIYREDDAADIVAGGTGIILRMSVLSGKAVVQPGQAVLKGETLVTGLLDSLANAPRAVRSRAEILAETCYEIMAVSPAQTAKTAGEGRTLRRFALCVGKTRVNFYGKAGKALDGYDKMIREDAWGIEGLFMLPVRFIREELRPYASAPGGSPSAEELQQRLYDGLAAQIDGEILSASFFVSEEEGRLCVTMRAVCRENIAKTVDITTQ